MDTLSFGNHMILSYKFFFPIPLDLLKVELNMEFRILFIKRNLNFEDGHCPPFTTKYVYYRNTQPFINIETPFQLSKNDFDEQWPYVSNIWSKFSGKTRQKYCLGCCLMKHASSSC